MKRSSQHLQSSMDPSSSSDDTDDSVKANGEGYLNTTQNSNSKRKRLKTGLNQSITENRLEPTFPKREYSEDDSSLSSELAASSVTGKQTMGNKSIEKLKKKRESDIYYNNSSEEENVSKMSNSREKANKKEKRKMLNNYDLSKNDKTVIKNEFNNESDSETSDEFEYTKKNSLERVDIPAVKKEVLSDDILSSSSDSDSDCESNSHSTTINQVIENVKNEVQNSSDSEEDDEITSHSKPPARLSVTESPVRILQDVRLTPKSKSTKEKLLELYPGIKQIEIATEIYISENEDIHLFRIPKNVDLSLLKNTEISLENECKVNLDEKYIITPTTKVPDPTLVISANPGVLFFKNNIKMERYIKSKVEPNIEVPEKKLIPLPENLKKRHPLFGSDFQQKIVLSEQVEKKLDEAIANLLKRERKSKKKNKKIKKDNVEKPEEIFDMFNSHNFLTNDRIKKETSDDSAFGSCSSVDRPKSKKKEKQRVSDNSIEHETELCTEKEPKEKKKEKKKKHSNDHSWIDVSTIKEEIPDSVVNNEGLTSPKKRKSSVINSTLMSDILRTPQFNPEISTIVSDPSPSGKKSKKSKKDKTHNQEDNIEKEELISQLLNNMTRELNFSKSIKTEF